MNPFFKVTGWLKMSYEFRHTLTHFYVCTNTCKHICVCVLAWAGNTFAMYTNMCEGLNLISDISLDWSLFHLLRQDVLLDLDFPNSR